MRQVFSSDAHERQFRHDGYVVIDLLDAAAADRIWAFYAEHFTTRRPVVDFARDLPYYISVFDADPDHKRAVDALISGQVTEALAGTLIDYEVFSSNFMIKFAGDGQIEAHQDFNFVDESRFTAFNLWCPLVDTDARNGALSVIPGSHRVFQTQRGPNLPKALTEYNELLRRYMTRLTLTRGQAVIFDHRLIHYSPPNHSDAPRVAIQSVLKPVEAAAIHCVFDPVGGLVNAHRIDQAFVLDRNLWQVSIDDRPLDHQQPLIPLPSRAEVIERLADLTVGRTLERAPVRVFADPAAQTTFDADGLVTLPVLDAEDVRELTELFRDATGGTVENSAYGMYIGLDDENLERKRALMGALSTILVPKVAPHFVDCKPHLGSFLVKAPGPTSYTYPHQDWTFVDAPYASMTVWIALVDTHERNGTLGFVRGSHHFFDQPVGSPSPEFRTPTQGHEALLYQYLDLVPLRAGEAVVFDNRTIHGAPPNLTADPRIAVAIGMTPRPAALFHHFLVPGSVHGARRSIAKLRVQPSFFERHTVASLQRSFHRGELPEGGHVDTVTDDEFLAFGADEIRALCARAGHTPSGRHLRAGGGEPAAVAGRAPAGLSARVGQLWKSLRRA